MFSSLGTMLLQPMGNKETQIRFKIQKDGEPVWDQTVIDRLKILAAAGFSWRGKAEPSRRLR